MKKLPALQLEEIPGDQYPDRESAQRAALPQLSESLRAVIQDLLERGELVNDNGNIIPNPSRFHGNGCPSPKEKP
jgi:hypothetical protein